MASLADLMTSFFQGAGSPGGGDITEVGASSGDVANAAAVATLPAVAGKTNYLTGFEVVFTGATAAATVLVTVTGLVGGTRTYPVVFPAGAGVAGTPLVVDFSRAIPANALNTAIVVTLPAGGAGNLHAAVNARGYVR